jgi:hypothetical protein
VCLQTSTTNRGTSGVQITPRNALKGDQIDFLVGTAPVAGHRPGESSPARASIEDAGGLAIANLERHLIAGGK